MGWMSWAKFLCQVDCVRHPFTCINENLYMQMADRLSEDGYLDAGYEYIHIDDCWMELKRSPDGLLVANRTRFPSGIAFLRNYVHRKGLKLGIYVDVGSATCEGYPGSFGHFETDVKTFAKWGIDYLKADGCNLDSDLQADAYIALGRAINATAHPMVYGTEWPLYLLLTNHTSLINYSAIGEHCNVFRNFWDANLSEKWLSVQRIIDFYGINQDKFINASGPGRWLDPDEVSRIV
ncbi:hypothetical protein AB6A40_008638 [Gnathostoma spinigerum]|uniref:Alpha-galactosidase n=1 Tax=Gnathostoma spinigerum TaxID=75299 RepID=A0ABD6EPM9_9BILA